MKKEFPLLEKITYLDNAAGTLKPLSVIAAMNEYYASYPMNPHSVDSRLGMHVFNLVAEARELVASLVNASSQEVIFTSGTTDSLNRIASMISPLLKPGDIILVSPFNHLSNLIPWIELARRTQAKVVYSQNFIDDINSSVKVVAVAQKNNTLNINLDLELLYKKARSFGVLVINDAAQAIAQEKVSLDFCDVVAWSGTKLYGPTGIGVLVVKKDLLSQLKPSTFGGGAVADISAQEWIAKSDISRFEAGTPHTAGIIGLGAAIKFFNNFKNERLADAQKVADYAHDQLIATEGIKVYSQRGDFNILFNYKDFAPQDVVSYLGHKDIILRAGEHCAKAMKDYVEFNSSIRLSVALYNSCQDIDKVIEAIKNGGDFLDFI